MTDASKASRGFTLIELLVVVAIIALLVSILLPSLGRAKDLALTIVCANRHKGTLAGWVYYGTDFNGVYMAPWDRVNTWPGVPLTSSVKQYPYTLVHYVTGGGIPRGEVLWDGDYAAKGLNGPWYSEDGRHPYPPSLCELEDAPQLQCPVMVSMGAAANRWYDVLSLSYFVMGWGQDQQGIWRYNTCGYPRPDLMTHQATTGLSMCLSGITDEGQPNCWCHFDGYPMDPHMEKSNYTFCDGHVETLSVSATNEQMWQSLWERGS